MNAIRMRALNGAPLATAVAKQQLETAPNCASCSKGYMLHETILEVIEAVQRALPVDGTSGKSAEVRERGCQLLTVVPRLVE